MIDYSFKTGDEFLKWAESAHKEFVDLMHKDFGLQSPLYSGIILQPLLCSGGVRLIDGEVKIILNDVLPLEKNFEDHFFTIIHESAHSLSPRLRKSKARADEEEYETAENIANYAVLCYSFKHYHDFLPIAKEKVCECASQDIALRLFEKNKNILPEIVNFTRESQLIALINRGK